MYLLDTNVISETRRARPHGGVLAWLRSKHNSTLYISAFSAGEIQAGVEITRRRDPGRADALEDWLEEILGAFNVLPMNHAAFRVWAKLKHGRSTVYFDDAMIAATAIVHGYTVVTRNIRHFSDFGVPLIDPFNFNE